LQANVGRRQLPFDLFPLSPTLFPKSKLTHLSPSSFNTHVRHGKKKLESL
jgi:hypothetical protein